PRELLVAGGIGVAPLHYLARRLRQAGSEVVFLLGARSKGQLLAFSSLTEMGVELLVATNDGSTGYKGNAGQLLTGYLRQNPAPDRLYCCGPRPMIEQVVSIAARQQIPVQASHEERMACGLGACMGCAFHHSEDSADPEDYHYYRRLCVDGPVISYRHRR
ncbi:MAG TPA: dihydroorotate dehydrogenase electron transfer subunit, partial [Firmicutes bacterium]|nr:dihydroorotate dehydrogenase electron transfer subunit [Bacillota bacterium]